MKLSKLRLQRKKKYITTLTFFQQKNIFRIDKHFNDVKTVLLALETLT